MARKFCEIVLCNSMMGITIKYVSNYRREYVGLQMRAYVHVDKIITKRGWGEGNSALIIRRNPLSPN